MSDECPCAQCVAEKARCETCRFWCREEGDRVGDCRRHAPQRFDDSPCLWPVTHPHEWCGDYERRTEER